MQVDAKQLEKPPKKVGTWKGRDVMRLVTKGGLNLLIAPGDGSWKTLGTGGHFGIARAAARKLGHEVAYTELSKADFVDEAFIERFVPRAVAMTLAIRRAHGEE